MIILLPGETLDLVLGAAPANTQPTYSFAWGDNGASAALGSAKGSANGVTTVQAVPTPAAGSERVVRSGYVYNGDTATAVVRLMHNTGSVEVPVANLALPPGDTLVFGSAGFVVVAGASSAGSDADRIVADFSYGDASPQVLMTPANALTVILARVVIDTAFNGIGAALALGTSASPSLLMGAAGNLPGTVGTYDANPDAAVASATPIQLTITPGIGASQGAGRIILDAIA